MKKNRLSQRLTWLVGLIGLLSVFYAGPAQAGDWLYLGLGFDLNMTTLGNNRDYDSFGGGALFYIGSRVHRSVAIEIKSVLDGQRYQYHFRYNVNLNLKLFVPSPRQTEPYFMIGGGYGGIQVRDTQDRVIGDYAGMGPEIGFGIDFRPSEVVTIGPRLSYQYLNLWINDNEWLGPAGHERRDLHTFFFTCYIHFNVI